MLALIHTVQCFPRRDERDRGGEGEPRGRRGQRKPGGRGGEGHPRRVRAEPGARDARDGGRDAGARHAQAERHCDPEVDGQPAHRH